MFRIYRTRSNYWSSSALAHWIRTKFLKEEKPMAATPEEWRDWRRAARLENKHVYWFTEKFLNKVQNFFMFPVDVWDGFMTYLRNRFYTKTHTVVTTLSRGEWHESEELMLHSMFQVLVDYIEIEKAYQALWSEEGQKEYKEKYSWWNRHNPFKQWRSPEFGIKYLEWEMSLVHDESGGVKPDDPAYGKLSRQALSAYEQMELYLWWTEVRPYRPDPMELSGYMNEWTRCRGKRGDDLISDLCEPKDAKYYKALHDTWDIEKAQHQEDEDMMIRLIKIRDHLWT